MKKQKQEDRKTRIFAYNGEVAIKAGSKFLNDPTQPGQLGAIVLLENIEISREALDILKKVKRSGDDVGDVMCWEAGDKKCFGWMGGPAYWLHKEAEADRDYTPELLESRVCDVQPDDDFIKAVDKRNKAA